MPEVTVVIPVGPDPIYLQWLPECIESVLNQTQPPAEILIIDDSQNPKSLDEALEDWIWWGHSFRKDWYKKETPDGVLKTMLTVFKTPWNVGVADAFNFGVGLADNALVFMSGSDDKLLPTCLEECVKEYEKQKVEGWYNVTIVTDQGEEQWLPNNSAMVTKRFWKWLGGFPPSAGLAACDALALSILMVHAPAKIIQVKQGTPLCWVRTGAYQDTRKNMSYFALSGAVEAVRNLETQRFVPHTED